MTDTHLDEEPPDSADRLDYLVDPDQADEMHQKVEAHLDQLLGLLASNVVPGEQPSTTFNREGAQLANAFFDGAAEMVDEGAPPESALCSQIGRLAALVIACAMRLNHLDPV